MTTRKIIERVSARVFCHLEQGGNPVTIFSSSDVLSPKTREKLAKDCAWESVMVATHDNDNNTNTTNTDHNNENKLPLLSFYMPSGEQVSFCAHAAMGAALELCLQDDDETRDEVSVQIADLMHASEVSSASNETRPSKEVYQTIIYDADIVALNMTVPYKETEISQTPLLYRMLRDYLLVEPADLATIAGTQTPQNICNASIARPKTLVPLASIDSLQNKTIAPKPSSSKGFELSCNALDQSTGIYLYAKSETEDGAWECRQFPRSLGYPEDPATGIAAAALACHLYHREDIDLPAYKMYQGTAMGKPSLIVVDELTVRKFDHDMMQASFRLLGRVEIDERESIEIIEDA